MCGIIIAVDHHSTYLFSDSIASADLAVLFTTFPILLITVATVTLHKLTPDIWRYRFISWLLHLTTLTSILTECEIVSRITRNCRKTLLNTVDRIWRLIHNVIFAAVNVQSLRDYQPIESETVWSLSRRYESIILLQTTKPYSLISSMIQPHCYFTARRLTLVKMLMETERTYCTDLWQLTQNYSRLLYSTRALSKKDMKWVDWLMIHFPVTVPVYESWRFTSLPKITAS